MPSTEPIGSTLHGWVYVLSHPHMTALKVGYTLRSVQERIDELSGTSVPGTFVWEYGILVSQPEVVEQQSHKLLSTYRLNANREFFSCPLPVAASALIAGAGARAIRQVHDRSQVEQRAARIREQLQLLDAWRESAENDIAVRTQKVYAEAESLKPHFAWFWLGYTFVTVLIFEQIFGANNEVGLWLISGFVGSIAGFFHQDHIYSKRKSAATIQDRVNGLHSLQTRITEHASAQKRLIGQGTPFIPYDAEATAEPNDPHLSTKSNGNPKPAVLEQSSVHAATTPKELSNVQSRVVREIPTRKFGCPSCGRTVNLNAKAFCSEVRCPAKLLTDA